MSRKDNGDDKMLNGYDLEGFRDQLSRIDERTERHSYQLEGLLTPLNTIAANTTTMAQSFREMKDENRALVKIIAGKWQVPMTIFLMVVAVLGIVIVMERAEKTGTNIHASGRELSIEHRETK